MIIRDFINLLDIDFYTGVPDSTLKSLSSYLIDNYSYNSNKHIIAANEGNATAIAAGYYLSSGKVPCVYLQNSGLGNIINPLTSLLHPDVYGIPCLFIIGWRGMPGIEDEPQHKFQGKITCELLDLLDIAYKIIDKNTSNTDLVDIMDVFRENFRKGKQCAIVVCPGTFDIYVGRDLFRNTATLSRAEAIEIVLNNCGSDVVVATTGKIARELYALREQRNETHSNDFLCVGGMGHASSLALGVALNEKKKVWILDGDGAFLMHMGADSVIRACNRNNIVHVILNNGCYQSVGGQPVLLNATASIIARSVNYSTVYTCSSSKHLNGALATVKRIHTDIFVEVLCSDDEMPNLGRPSDIKELKSSFEKRVRNNEK